MSDRDCEYKWEDIREKILQADTIEPTILSQILKEMTFDGELVSITHETKDKLNKYNISLESCGEEDDGESQEQETSELVVWMDSWILENYGEDATLNYSQKKSLPDSAYAYIEPECKKEDGKTQQSCRHFLIHDEAHVKAALQALGGARIGKKPEFADKAKPKICAAAKKFKIKSDVCETKGEDLPTTDQILQETERVLRDIKRIVG